LDADELDTEEDDLRVLRVDPTINVIVMEEKRFGVVAFVVVDALVASSKRISNPFLSSQGPISFFFNSLLLLRRRQKN
jgi:hypothetical protein